MKKYIFLASILLFSFYGYSQTFKLKPTIGINTSIQNVNNTSKNKVKLGYDLGVLMEMPLKQNLSFEAGFLYSKNRASLERTFIYPFYAPFLDAPQVKEEYTLNLLKVPILILLKQNKNNPIVFGFGTVVKYNFNSKRTGEVIDRPEKYSSNFTIDTKSESKFGFGIQSSVRKELNINNRKFSVGLFYDTDLSKWRYPTNFELEEKTYYSLRTHNFSLMFSIEL